MLGSVSKIGPAQQMLKFEPVTAPKNAAVQFKDVLNEKKAGSALETIFDPTQFNQLQQLQKTLFSGKEIPLKDLIRYQVQAGQFGLSVELVSKLGESLMATIRKFQNGQ